MLHPYDPHPLWRRNFEFTAAYPATEKNYTLDPIVEPKIKPIVEFKLDPVIHKFSSQHS